MIKSLAHVCFVVRDLDTSIAFYRDTLGLKQAFEFRNEKDELFGVYLHVGGRSFIELFKGQVGQRAEKQTFQHLCLEVDDIKAELEMLRAKGIAVTEMILGSDCAWQAWLKDPDGNAIELHCYTPESKQTRFLK